MLIADPHRKIQPLEGIQIGYSCWGWADVSHDFMPRIVQPDRGDSIFYALGYGGSGVPSGYFSDNVYVKHELFAPFRPLGQRWLYRRYYIQDEIS